MANAVAAITITLQKLQPFYKLLFWQLTKMAFDEAQTRIMFLHTEFPCGWHIKQLEQLAL